MPVRRVSPGRQPWNKGLLVGQKKPLEPKHVWSIRVRLEIAGSKRDLAIFNLAIDSKLRACDLDDRFHETGIEETGSMELEGCWWIPRLRLAERGAVSWQDGVKRSRWR